MQGLMFNYFTIMYKSIQRGETVLSITESVCPEFSPQVVGFFSAKNVDIKVNIFSLYWYDNLRERALSVLFIQISKCP